MGGGFRATLRQDGFPGPFQVLEVTLVEASVVGSAHWRDDFHYDPQTQGAISTIEYSWDVNILDPGHLFFSLLLVQGDTYYRTGWAFSAKTGRRSMAGANTVGSDSGPTTSFAYKAPARTSPTSRSR